MTSENKTGPRNPTEGGAKITEDPVQGMRSGWFDYLRTFSGAVTGPPGIMNPGLLEL